jgi:urease accessory protein
VQPFRESAVEVCGVYELETQGQGAGEASLCVLDWVCEGRRARGEHWSFHSYRSKNEVYAVDPATQKRRLLLRDNQILNSHASSTLPRGKKEGDGEEELASRMDGLGAFGTLILHGPLFASLGDAFIDDFAALPRIGGRKWDDDTPQPSPPAGSLEAQRAARRKQEERDGVVWSTARVRGFVMVKFGAREVEGARRWVRRVIEEEGSVVRGFGERAVLCLK